MLLSYKIITLTDVDLESCETYNGPAFTQIMAASGAAMVTKTIAKPPSLRSPTWSNQSEPAPFDFTDTDTTQRLLKARAYCVRMNLQVNQTTFAAFDEARAEYIRSVGVSAYLAQMLNGLAHIPAQACRFFQMPHPHLPLVLPGDYHQPVQSFLQPHFQQHPLYLKVEKHSDNQQERLVRYL
jgi:hypothetical protein